MLCERIAFDTPAGREERILLWQRINRDIFFLSDCVEIFFGHVLGSTKPKKATKCVVLSVSLYVCLSAFFVLHSPVGRCN